MIITLALYTWSLAVHKQLGRVNLLVVVVFGNAGRQHNGSGGQTALIDASGDNDGREVWFCGTDSGRQL